MHLGCNSPLGCSKTVLQQILALVEVRLQLHLLHKGFKSPVIPYTFFSVLKEPLCQFWDKVESCLISIISEKGNPSLYSLQETVQIPQTTCRSIEHTKAEDVQVASSKIMGDAL